MLIVCSKSSLLTFSKKYTLNNYNDYYKNKKSTFTNPKINHFQKYASYSKCHLIKYDQHRNIKIQIYQSI